MTTAQRNEQLCAPFHMRHVSLRHRKFPIPLDAASLADIFSLIPTFSFRSRTSHVGRAATAGSFTCILCLQLFLTLRSMDRYLPVVSCVPTQRKQPNAILLEERLRFISCTAFLVRIVRKLRCSGLSTARIFTAPAQHISQVLIRVSQDWDGT